MKGRKSLRDECESGSEHVELKVSIRLELNNGVVFGSGRYMILEQVEKYGSLKKAAEDMGMSYRAAWGKIKKSEELLGAKLIEKTTNKEGYHLTPFGRKMRDYYKNMHQKAEECLAVEFNDLFTELGCESSSSE